MSADVRPKVPWALRQEESEEDLVSVEGYDSLTVGQLREALAGLDPDMEAETGYYTCHGVSIIRFTNSPPVVNIINSE